MDKQEQRAETSDLEKELEAAVTAELAEPPAAPAPRVAPFRIPKASHLKVSEIPEARPEKAADQIAMAIAGLLKAEEELRLLAQDIVGEISHNDEAERNTTPSDKGPLLPRLRSDAELMARLAIRIVKLCEEVRTKL